MGKLKNNLQRRQRRKTLPSLKIKQNNDNIRKNENTTIDIFLKIRYNNRKEAHWKGRNE